MVKGLNGERSFELKIKYERSITFTIFSVSKPLNKYLYNQVMMAVTVILSQVISQLSGVSSCSTTSPSTICFLSQTATATTTTAASTTTIEWSMPLVNSTPTSDYTSEPTLFQDCSTASGVVPLPNYTPQDLLYRHELLKSVENEVGHLLSVENITKDDSLSIQSRLKDINKVHKIPGCVLKLSYEFAKFSYNYGLPMTKSTWRAFTTVVNLASGEQIFHKGETRRTGIKRLVKLLDNKVANDYPKIRREFDPSLAKLEVLFKKSGVASLVEELPLVQSDDQFQQLKRVIDVTGYHCEVTVKVSEPVNGEAGMNITIVVDELSPLDNQPLIRHNNSYFVPTFSGTIDEDLLEEALNGIMEKLIDGLDNFGTKGVNSHS